ncbi:permease-like cell division protein FtsX [Candidatus Saccharibacteria bacterium]|nr:permease-like cell division protein FtsX [Candidatus Saccharibacteria bacterium]
MSKISSEERLAKNRARNQVKMTKKNLRTMSRNGKAHKARSTVRIVRYGAVGFARNVWLSVASTVVMTITILIMITTLVASAIFSSTADTFLREKVDITIFLKPRTSASVMKEMTTALMEDKNVRQVVATTSEEVFEKYLEENQDNKMLMKTLSEEEMKNLAISAMQASLRIKVYNLEDTSGIERIVSENPLFVDNLDPNYPPNYDTNRKEIETINNVAGVINRIGWILSAIFIAISILVIFNTIQMAIFSRREEIYMMRLVGADKTFIRGPFIVESQISGIIAGLLASTAAYFGYKAIAPGLVDCGVDVSKISNIVESEKLVLVYLCSCLVGMLIGALSAQLAIKKYLTKKRK